MTDTDISTEAKEENPMSDSCDKHYLCIDRQLVTNRGLVTDVYHLGDRIAQIVMRSMGDRIADDPDGDRNEPETVIHWSTSQQPISAEMSAVVIALARESAEE